MESSGPTGRATAAATLPVGGGVDLKLQLGTAGLFTGTVLVPAEVEIKWLTLVASEGDRHSWLSHLDEDRRFSFPGIEAGEYRITAEDSQGYEFTSEPERIRIPEEGLVGAVIRVVAK